MVNPQKIDRRAVLRGVCGATLALPVLEAMGQEVASETPRRFCAAYTANGMALPRAANKIGNVLNIPRPDAKDMDHGLKMFERLASRAERIETSTHARC